jgi:TPR repeat protein
MRRQLRVALVCLLALACAVAAAQQPRVRLQQQHQHAQHQAQGQQQAPRLAQHLTAATGADLQLDYDIAGAAGLEGEAVERDSVHAIMRNAEAGSTGDRCLQAVCMCVRVRNRLHVCSHEHQHVCTPAAAADAIYLLALLRLYGIGCAADASRAVLHLRDAAARGLADAEAALGMLLYHGIGAAPDANAALQLFR